MAAGTSPIPGCCASLIEGAVAGFGRPFKRDCLTLRTTAGYAEQSYIETHRQRALSAMGMLTRQMSLLRYADRSCASRKRVRSIEPFAKLMGLESVPSKSWGGCLNRESAAARPRARKNRRGTPTVQTMVSTG